MSPPNETILITGGSGFVGSHCILQGLQTGYNIRTTVRSLSRSDDVKKMLRNGGATGTQLSNLSFHAADLTKDEGWEEACTGCTYVLHVASPFPLATPKNEDELIVPAREGTLRALRFAKAAGSVRRVVVTSSMASVAYGYGAETHGKVFTEDDFTILDGSKGDTIAPYMKSKAIAERAAWDWIKKEGGNMELSVVCPVAIFGPVLSGDFAASIEIVSRMLNGQMPGCPPLSFKVVDVRDVADAHFRVMTDPKAGGERYLACADDKPCSMKDVALTLKEGLTAEESKKVSTMGLPKILLRVIGLFDAGVASIVPEAGIVRDSTNAKAKRDLNWEPRSAKEAILSSARSLREHGVVKA